MERQTLWVISIPHLSASVTVRGRVGRFVVVSPILKDVTELLRGQMLYRRQQKKGWLDSRRDNLTEAGHVPFHSLHCEHMVKPW